MASCCSNCILLAKQVMKAASLERRLLPIYPLQGCQPLEIRPERTARIVGWDHRHPALNGTLFFGRDDGA